MCNWWRLRSFGIDAHQIPDTQMTVWCRVGFISRYTLVMPSLLVAEGLQGLLTAAANEARGSTAHPRAGLPEVIEQLRGVTDVLETMPPAEPPSA